MDTQTYNNLQSGNYAKLVQQNKELQAELKNKEYSIQTLWHLINVMIETYKISDFDKQCIVNIAKFEDEKGIE